MQGLWLCWACVHNTCIIGTWPTTNSRVKSHSTLVSSRLPLCKIFFLQNSLLWVNISLNIYLICVSSQKIWLIFVMTSFAPSDEVWYLSHLILFNYIVSLKLWVWHFNFVIFMQILARKQIHWQDSRCYWTNASTCSIVCELIPIILWKIKHSQCLSMDIYHSLWSIWKWYIDC